MYLVEVRESINKVFFHSFADAFNIILEFGRALYRKDAGQVLFFRLSIAFRAFLIRSSAGNVGVSLWQRFLGLSLLVALAGCLRCLLPSPHFSLSCGSWSGLISLYVILHF